jgi:hypothetical protein
MREVGEVYYPDSLLTRSSAKTVKGEKYGWETNILYLAPHKQNILGKNLCPNATAGCAAACLYTAGRGKFNSVQRARMNKTTLFLKEKDWFVKQLYKELKNIEHKNTVEGMFKTNLKQCVRLNGTSDIPWENIYKNNMNLLGYFPDVQFYDYTKSVKRILENKIKNYHLTFSRSENNEDDCIKVLEAGHNVAMVFNKDFYKRNLFDGGTAFYTMKGKQYKVIDGDQSDLRFLDPQGVIIGLKAKGDASKDTSGFVI